MSYVIPTEQRRREIKATYTEAGRELAAECATKPRVERVHVSDHEAPETVESAARRGVYRAASGADTPLTPAERAAARRRAAQ